MGDFNINLLALDQHIPSSEFLELMYTLNFYPLINKPTRVGNSSATLIDNIFCNNIQNHDCLNGIMYTDISDHFLILSIHVKVVTTEPSRFIKTRRFTQHNFTHFSECLQNTEWSDVYASEDCQNAYTFLMIRLPLTKLL